MAGVGVRPSDVHPSARAALPPLVGGSDLIEGLGCVQLEVEDLERSLSFYRDGLRFRFEDEDLSSAPSTTLRAGDLQVVLVQRIATSRARAKVRGAGVLLSLAVAGVDAYRDALVARGISASVPRDVNGSRSFTVLDPDGYAWRFGQDGT